MYNRWLSPLCATELYHHGVKGMKWGVRKDRQRGINGEGRYILKAQKQASKGTARGYSKALNTLDRGYAKQVGKVYESAYAGNAWFRQDKKRAKGVNASKSMDALKSMTDDIIKKAEKAGYTVNSRSTVRYTNSYVNTSKWSGSYQVQHVGRKYVVSNKTKTPNALFNWNQEYNGPRVKLVQYRYY